MFVDKQSLIRVTQRQSVQPTSKPNLMYLSKPVKQVWYWALRVYWDQFRVYVCMSVCMYV